MSTLFNRVKFTSSTTGATAFGVGAAATGFRTPATAGVSNGTAVSYTAESSDRSQWETGHGTCNTAGPTISRTTVLENSSGTTSAINFSAAPTVWLDLLAQDIPTGSDTQIQINNGGALGADSHLTWNISGDGLTAGSTGGSNLTFTLDNFAGFHGGIAANAFAFVSSFDSDGANPAGGLFFSGAALPKTHISAITFEADVSVFPALPSTPGIHFTVFSFDDSGLRHVTVHGFDNDYKKNSNGQYMLQLYELHGSNSGGYPDSVCGCGVNTTVPGAVHHVLNPTTINDAEPAGYIVSLVEGRADQTADLVQVKKTGGSALLSVNATGVLSLGLAGTLTGTAKFVGTTSGVVTVKAADAAGTWTFKWPTTAGTSGYFLQTDGSGNTTWAAVSSVVNSGTSGQIAYYAANGTAVSGAANSSLDAFGNLVLTSGTIRCTGRFMCDGGNAQTRLTSTQSLVWTPSTNEQVSGDVGFSRIAAGVIGLGTGAAGSVAGWSQWGGQARVSTQFDKTSDTTLANVTGLSVTLTSGRTYSFNAVLYVTSNASGGAQVAIAGTSSATAIRYRANSFAATTLSAASQTTTKGNAVGAATAAIDAIEIDGTITVNAGGTLTIQFAQNASFGTASSVLVGSYMIVQDMP